MFSKISMASIFLLLSDNRRVILPPPYLCCGYPLKVNAQKKAFDRIFLENIIILTQIRDMFHDLKFDACVVSCGTCMESLNELGASSVFDCEIKDISGYILDNNPTITSNISYLYHAPCHDSLKESGLPRLRSRGIKVQSIPYCCSEAGTLAISRPDISHSMFLRKQNAAERPELRSGSELNSKATPKLKSGKKRKILTNCPSCIQGLGRQPTLAPIHLAEELALLRGGEKWEQTFKKLVKPGEVITF